jgi:hypothetical protein
MPGFTWFPLTAHLWAIGPKSFALRPAAAAREGGAVAGPDRAA